MTNAIPCVLPSPDSGIAYMRFRTVERCCSFFREHVLSTSRILDCGCGPGSITVGLARWAPDGQTIGIDRSPKVLAAARALARELDVTNVRFLEANILALPFEDDSFDLVFSQTVFLHLANRDQALAEIKRVLRPGGLVALRDGIFGSIVAWPDDAALREIARVVSLGAQHGGGHPEIGRELGTLLSSAGFSEVFQSLRFEQAERPEERATYFSLMAGLLDHDLEELAVAQGWSTVDALDRARDRLRHLAEQSGATFSVPFGQAVGRKPVERRRYPRPTV